MDIKKVFEQIEDKFDRLFNATVKFTKCATRNDDSNPRHFRSYDIWVCENGHDEAEAIKYSAVLESDIELAMKEIRSEMIERVYYKFPFTSKFNSIVKAVEDFADKNEMTEKQGRDKINEVVAEQLVTTLDIELEKIVNSRIEDPFDYDEPYRVFFTFEEYEGDSDIRVHFETYYFIFIENGTIERGEVYQLADSNDFADRVANNCIEIFSKLID